jgi:hypothetical protein
MTNRLIPTVIRYEDVSLTHAAGHDVVRQCAAEDVEFFLGKPQLPALRYDYYIDHEEVSVFAEDSNMSWFAEGVVRPLFLTD